MPNLAANGPITEAIDALITLLANVPAYQAWIGATDPNPAVNLAAALASISAGEIGTPVASVAVASNVLTVKLREPAPIAVGQIVTLTGPAIGVQGSTNLCGSWLVTSIVAVELPWVDPLNNPLSDPSHNPYQYTGTDAIEFTALLNAADIAEFFPDGAVCLACGPRFAVVCKSGKSLSTKSIANGLQILNGELEILLEGNISAQYRMNAVNAMREMENAFGSIVQGIAALADTDDYMLIRSMEQVDPEFISESEQVDGMARFEKWRGLIRVSWGLDS